MSFFIIFGRGCEHSQCNRVYSFCLMDHLTFALIVLFGFLSCVFIVLYKWLKDDDGNWIMSGKCVKYVAMSTSRNHCCFCT